MVIIKRHIHTFLCWQRMQWPWIVQKLSNYPFPQKTYMKHPPHNLTHSYLYYNEQSKQKLAVCKFAFHLNTITGTMIKRFLFITLLLIVKKLKIGLLFNSRWFPKIRRSSRDNLLDRKYQFFCRLITVKNMNSCIIVCIL